MIQNYSSSEYWYDDKAADRAVLFFKKCLIHTKGEWAGQPFILSDWQAEKVIKPIFGWKRQDGTRKYRTVFILIPRKAGKSTLAAGIANYLLFADGEMGAEVYSAAADREQAAIVFEMAKTMVETNNQLKQLALTYKRSIVVRSTASSYKVLSSESYTKHGLNASGIVIDEVHALPDRDLWDVLTTSTGARRQPLTVAITTAGFDRNSLCYELYDYATKVRDGVIKDEAFLPIIFEAGIEDDWRDPDTWRKAHPGLGVSIKQDYFQAECKKAQELPSYENTFKRLLLNIWTEQNTRWMPIDTWDKCNKPYPKLEGLTCYAGLDLASTTDIAALVLAFLVDSTVHLLPFFFVPSEGIRKRSGRDKAPYMVWSRQGLLIETEGNVIDYEVIRNKINDLNEIYHIKEIAIDRWNATHLATQLTGDGFELIGFGQGFASMSAPTKELERRVLSQEINHGGNEVLRYMINNVSIQQDAAGNMKPNKAKSNGRIDGISATLMALGRIMQNLPDTEIDKKEILFV